MKKKIPRCNGRPQLWHSISKPHGKYDRLRIIYPNGRVMFCFDNVFWPGNFLLGCTSRKTQKAAILACVEYSKHFKEDVIFLGYL